MATSVLDSARLPKPRKLAFVGGSIHIAGFSSAGDWELEEGRSWGWDFENATELDVVTDDLGEKGSMGLGRIGASGEVGDGDAGFISVAKSGSGTEPSLGLSKRHLSRKRENCKKWERCFRLRTACTLELRWTNGIRILNRFFSFMDSLSREIPENVDVGAFQSVGSGANGTELWIARSPDVSKEEFPLDCETRRFFMVPSRKIVKEMTQCRFESYVRMGQGKAHSSWERRGA